MKVLFCHIPKCSGTNTNYYLETKYKKDYVWYIHRILKYDVLNYSEYYKFTIIRDPLEKIVSLYFYQSNFIDQLKKIDQLSIYQEGNWNELNKLYLKYNITNITSFLNNYLTFYNNEIKPHICNLENINKTKNMTIYYIVGYLPQYLFILDDNYNSLVDDIVNINQIDTFMKNKFEIILNKEKKNIHKNSNDNYYNYLTPENIKDIKEIYQEDYKYLFNNSIENSKQDVITSSDNDKVLDIEISNMEDEFVDNDKVVDIEISNMEDEFVDNDKVLDIEISNMEDEFVDNDKVLDIEISNMEDEVVDNDINLLCNFIESNIKV